MIEGRIGTQGRIKYSFQIFGAVAILFIEIKLKVVNDAERLKAIAQVIAECDGKSSLSLILSVPDIDVQAATKKMPLTVFFYLSTAFLWTARPSNFSSSKETQLHHLSAAAFLEIRFTAGVAWNYPTLCP